MSNSHIFMKSGFPRAPLQNGVGRYVCQLQRVTLKFCKNNGSSKGMRDFIEAQLLDFVKTNPGVVVYLKPRRHRTAVMVGEYLNGERQWVSCRNFTSQEIQKWLELMKTQNGETGAMRYRKMWHTDIPSIQGPWTPWTHKAPEMNLVTYPDEASSKALQLEPTATEKLIEIFKQQKIDETKS
uniref:Large ribosomal subunit protein mL43 n=1 Tax=Culicoides sonorensis TaxID=179676 RepID=A0A336MK23_CULSO